MKRAAMWMSLLVSFVFVGSLLFAEDAPKGAGDKPAKEGMKIKEGAAKEGAVKKDGEAKKDAARLGEIGYKMDKVVGGFSDDQKTQIADLNKAREAAIKEANDKFTKAALDLMTDEQKAKWQEANKEGAKKEGKGDAGKAGAKEGKGDGAKAGGLKEGGDAAK
jgi:hypothetical protein